MVRGKGNCVMKRWQNQVLAPITRTFCEGPSVSSLFLSIVQHRVRDDQAFHRAAADNVGVDDFIDVGEGDAAVPDRVGIHDHRGADFALFEAAGFIGADAIAGDAAIGQLRFERAMQFRFAGPVTAAARMSVGSLVRANENVLFKFCHGVVF